MNSRFALLIPAFLLALATQRAADAPLADRASTLNKLHSLRSEIAGFRSPR